MKASWALLLIPSILVGASQPPQTATPGSAREITCSDKELPEVRVTVEQETLIWLKEGRIVNTFAGSEKNWIVVHPSAMTPYLTVKAGKSGSERGIMHIVSDHKNSECSLTLVRVVGTENSFDPKVVLNMPGSSNDVQWITTDESKQRIAASDKRVAASDKRVADAEARVKQAQEESAREISKAKQDFAKNIGHYRYSWDEKVGKKLGIENIYADEASGTTYILAKPLRTPALFEVIDGTPAPVGFRFSDADHGYVVPKVLDKEAYLKIGKKLKMDIKREN